MKRNQFKAMLLAILFLWMASSIFANNLSLTPLSKHGHELELEIAWENSWNTDVAPNNHDAVWLFGKLKIGEGNWQHLHFDTYPNTQFVLEGEGLEIETDSLGLGLMIKNVQPGFRHQRAKLMIRFNEEPPLSGFEIRIFGIEMAWVNAGPFWLGDDGSNGTLANTANDPYLVQNEEVIPFGQLVSSGIGGPDADIPAAFPKGTQGFYLMKYELNQGQYVDFLNCLSFEQQVSRTNASPASSPGTLALQMGSNYNRNDIRIASSGIAGLLPATYVSDLDGDGLGGGNDGQFRACNWLSWPDLAAYLDWAALRPFTELEYEKACRGPEYPLMSQFAWGTDEIIDANTLLDDGQASERQEEISGGSAGIASHGYDGPQGPLRTGFAGRTNSTRNEAGAGYFGHMEMSGNLWEYCIPVFGEGLQFSGAFGDGELAENGAANVAGWPQNAGFKGGGWNSGIVAGFRDLAVSDRFYIDLNAQIRRATTGGRGAK